MNNPKKTDLRKSYGRYPALRGKGENVVRDALSGQVDEDIIAQIIHVIQQNQENNKQ